MSRNVTNRQATATLDRICLLGYSFTQLCEAKPHLRGRSSFLTGMRALLRRRDLWQKAVDSCRNPIDGSDEQLISVAECNAVCFEH
jgi:hypothetical protein